MLNQTQQAIGSGIARGSRLQEQYVKDSSSLIVSPLLGKLNSLENTIKELNGAIGSLNERLQPILAPMAPEVKSEHNGFPVSDIPLVNRITELDQQLLGSIGWLQDITNRLGV